ncbi:MAG: hypothetical protein VYA07_02395 [Candidatus Thermoplasmatota archaeon]|nr:hypothetical protein [Candidatus Thermoplasmatota archaeon]
MNWLGLFTLSSATDPELAPHAYLLYLLLWTFFVGLFVLFLFPVMGKTLGFIVITVLIILFVSMVWYFHQKGLFAD